MLRNSSLMLLNERDITLEPASIHEDLNNMKLNIIFSCITRIHIR